MAKTKAKQQTRASLGSQPGSLPVPDLDDPTVVFGGIDHMPAYDTLPEEFQRDWHRRSNEFCHAVSMWFYQGAKRDGDRMLIDGVTFRPRAGIDGDKALRAIRAVLGSWAPKHEHKIAACGYMLSQWFQVERISNKPAA